MKVLHSGVTQGEEGTALRKGPEMPALRTNLVRVGSTYKYRSRIPQDLLTFYHPKREVIESLRTKSLRHPEYGALSVAELLEHERPHLMPMPAPFDGYVESVHKVSSTSLVAVARNRYSVPCEFAGQRVSAISSKQGVL